MDKLQEMNKRSGVDPSVLDSNEYPVGLKEKINTFLDLQKKGISFNDRLMSSRAFRNPNIYRKLVEYLDLNETGSNDPFPLFGSHNPEFPLDSYYDVRSRLQMDAANIPTNPLPTKESGFTKTSQASVGKVRNSSILEQSIFNEVQSNDKKTNSVAKRLKN